MEERIEPKREPTDHNPLALYQNDITESLTTQSIPINIRIAQDIQEFLYQGSKAFKCCLCTRTFGRRDKIKRHLIECHYGIKDYKCSLCFKKFARNEHYTRHMNDVHSDTKDYHCRLCNRKFKRGSEFCHHLKTAHHDQSGVFASGSDSLFPRSEGENNNNQSLSDNHRSDNWLNNYEQQSLQAGQVDINLINVAGSGLYVELESDADKNGNHENPKLFECTLCGNSFDREDRLRRHYQETHDGTREHQCPSCEKRFHRKYRLNRHISEVHRAGKPFLCPYCHHEFAREWSYHQHLRKYHNDNMNSTPITCINSLEG